MCIRDRLTALKGLKEISSLIDLGSIQRGYGPVDTSQCFSIACDVMSVILLNIDPIKVQDNSDESNDSQSQDGDSDEENSDSQEGNGSGKDNTISDEELQDMIDSDSVSYTHLTLPTKRIV